MKRLADDRLPPSWGCFQTAFPFGFTTSSGARASLDVLPLKAWATPRRPSARQFSHRRTDPIRPSGEHASANADGPPQEGGAAGELAMMPQCLVP